MHRSMLTRAVRRSAGPVRCLRAIWGLCALGTIWLGSAVLVRAESILETASGTASQVAPIAANPTITSRQLSAERAKLVERISKLTALAASHSSTGDEPANVAAAAELSLLRSLELVYLSHQTVFEQASDAAAECERLKDELGSLPSAKDFSQQSTSWLVLEDYRDSLDSEHTRAKSRAKELAAALSALESSLQEQSRAERNRRQVSDESLGDSSEIKPSTDREYRLRLADLEAKLAAATVDWRRADLALKKVESEAAEQRRALLHARIERIQSQVVYSEADLQTRRSELQAYLAELRTRLTEAQRRWKQAAADSTHGSEETRRTVRRICHEEVIEIELRETEFEASLVIATQRFKLANGSATADERAKWRDSGRQTLETLASEDQRLALRAADVMQDLAQLHRQSRLGTKTNAADSAEEISTRTEHLERLLHTIEFCQRHVKAVHRGIGRFVADLERDSGSRAAEHWTAQVGASIRGVWGYELVAVGDRPITVAKVTKGIGGVIVGLMVATFLSRLLGRRVLPKMGLNPGASDALRSLSFYFMCVMFGTLSLEVAQVPLTAFTFLGGATAIGIGFGSQNILNNFISGLILLAEQPIRVGDLIEMDGEHGVVLRIGARSTILRTDASAEIVIPNSKLLESNVVNLTKSDRRLRSFLKVGVAYGSNIADVKRELKSAATSHPNVLKNPQPQVLFAEFGDNSLNFELHFWVQIASLLECRIIESELREAIDSSFRLAKIIVAFPQRDIHLETTTPLEVRMLSHGFSSHETIRLHEAA